jgi:hypothetical protein
MVDNYIDDDDDGCCLGSIIDDCLSVAIIFVLRPSPLSSTVRTRIFDERWFGFYCCGPAVVAQAILRNTVALVRMGVGRMTEASVSHSVREQFSFWLEFFLDTHTHASSHLLGVRHMNCLCGL